MAPVLIDGDELAAALATGTAPLVLDVRFTLGRRDGGERFRAGHVPGARFIDLDADLAGPPGAGGRHPLPDPAVFEAAMRRLGVRAERPVVAYDDATSLSAARLWWMLREAGHGDVRVLDGGFAAWTAAGQAVESGEGGGDEGDFVVRPGGLAWVDAAGAAAAVAAGHRLLDVRAPERFRGESEPIDAVAGHVPGAENLPAAGNHLSDGRFAPGSFIAARFGALSSDDVVYCGSGITAAQAVLAAAHAGLALPRLYAGSWSDWITDPARPVATGE